jgi:hypothetical protein
MSKRYRIRSEPYYTYGGERHSFTGIRGRRAPQVGDTFEVEDDRKVDPDGDLLGTIVETGGRDHIAVAVLEPLENTGTTPAPTIRADVLLDLLVEWDDDGVDRLVLEGLVALAEKRSA